jgi:hypothetical protein
MFYDDVSVVGSNLAFIDLEDRMFYSYHHDDLETHSISLITFRTANTLVS